MRAARRGGTVTTLLAAFALAGCAGASPSGGAAGGAEVGATPGETAIVIDHRNSSINSATIYLVPTSGGARRVLGIVAFREQRRFPVEISGSANYRLIAEGGGEPLTTRDFILRPGDVVEWDLFSSAVRRLE